MIIYEPIGYFEINRNDLVLLINKVLLVFPRKIEFKNKTFGSFSEYKCESFSDIYKESSSKLDNEDYGIWSDLAPIVFDFISRAIKHISLYVKSLELDEIDIDVIILDLVAREDIKII